MVFKKLPRVFHSIMRSQSRSRMSTMRNIENPEYIQKIMDLLATGISDPDYDQPEHLYCYDDESYDDKDREDIESDDTDEETDDESYPENIMASCEDYALFSIIPINLRNIRMIEIIAKKWYTTLAVATENITRY